jgi:hypothetical protein
MTHPTLIDIAWNTITQAHGDGQFALACLGFALLVGVYLLFRSIIRLARYPKTVTYQDWELM